ncbi:Uncharacterised protein [Enterobacter kobei]|nr:Uncharacterised protein [Enterobacter kobei]
MITKFLLEFKSISIKNAAEYDFSARSFHPFTQRNTG